MYFDDTFITVWSEARARLAEDALLIVCMSAWKVDARQLRAFPALSVLCNYLV